MTNEELEAVSDDDKVEEEVVAAFENYDGAIDDND